MAHRRPDSNLNNGVDGLYIHGWTMSVINARDRTCPSYYTYKFRLDHIGESWLLLLPPRILDTLKYFGQYSISCRMGTDPVLPAFSSRWCGEIDRGKIDVSDEFVSYISPTGNVYDLIKEAVQAKQLLRDSDGFRPR